ncbi:hypothetical protein MPTA5024_13795 [Microbispora sp. ATCC PTA-5024]|nr:hypothetical protein MPTA5024_13795 [Microbispora sp. ATCC PTA-5024]
MTVPGTRGTTSISDRAFMKIAEEVAREDDQVAGRPHASGSLSGSVAAVRFDLTVRYPAPVHGVAAHVREHVRERVRELTGVSVENVDIDVVGLVPAQRPAPRTGEEDRP